MGRPLPPQFALAGVSPPPSAVTAHALEIVQVIQDLQHSVPLIAGKTTMARAYVALPNDGPTLDLRGELRIINSSGAELRVPSTQAVKVSSLPSGSIQSLREDTALSLNFLLPVEATLSGSASFDLVSLYREGDGAQVPVNNKSVTVQFAGAPPLKVKFFGIRYQMPGSPTWFEPAEKHFRMAESWLRRTYPTHQVMVNRLVIDASKRWPLTCESVNLQLAGIRRQDVSAGADPLTHYFGLVDDRGGANFMRGCASDVPDHPAPDTVASGPAGSLDFGWDFDGSYADWYSGHELAHTFGRNHPGYCAGNSPSDPAFPFPDGQLSPNNGRFVGFDVGDLELGLPMLALPGQTWTDVMTYCEKQWMCSYTFEGILSRLREENAQGAIPLPVAPAMAGLQVMAALPEALPRVTVGKVGHFLASIEMGGDGTASTGKIHSFTALEKGIPSREFPDSMARVEFLADDNTILSVLALRVKISTCCEGHEHRSGMIDAVVSIPELAARVRLLLKDQVVDEWNMGRPPGSLRQMRAMAAAAAVEAVAPEDDNAHYTVQTSKDGGKTWETIAINVKLTQWDLQKRNYPGVSKVLVRIISSTGTTTNSRVTEVSLQ